MKKIIFIFLIIFFITDLSYGQIEKHLLDKFNNLVKFSVPVTAQLEQHYVVSCSGVIINNNTVLTAKHCLENNNLNIQKIIVRNLTAKRYMKSSKVDLAILQFNDNSFRHTISLSSSKVKMNDILIGNGFLDGNLFPLMIVVVKVIDHNLIGIGEGKNGVSGTGVFNNDNELVGIYGASFLTNDNIAILMNVDVIEQFLKENNIEYNKGNF